MIEPTRDSAPTPLDNVLGDNHPEANFATSINIGSGMIRDAGLFQGRSAFEPVAIPEAEQLPTASLSSDVELEVENPTISEANVVFLAPTGIDFDIPDTTSNSRSIVDTAPKETRGRNSARGRRLASRAGKVALVLSTLASPASAAGNAMQVTGGGDYNPDFCDNGDYVLQTDPVYATKLLEQLASGELVIAFGPVPVAALAEGDKTAAIQPKTITPDEIWANLAKPAPDCPVVTPLPAENGSAKEWPYKTTNEAIRAWNSKGIKIKKEDRWKADMSPNAFPQPYSNQNGEINPENSGGYNPYPGVVLGVEKVDDDYILIIGMEGKSKIRNINMINPNDLFDRERFTAAFRISNGVGGLAEVGTCAVGNCEDLSAFGIHLEDTSMAFDKLQKAVGKNIVVYNETFYFGPWLKPNPDLDKIRRDQVPAAEKFYRFSQQATNGKSIKGLILPGNVNVDPRKVHLNQLPETHFMYLKK